MKGQMKINIFFACGILLLALASCGLCQVIIIFIFVRVIKQVVYNIIVFVKQGENKSRGALKSLKII